MKELIELIEKNLRNKFNYVSGTRVHIEIIELFKLKYCCDQKILSYEEVIRSEDLSLLDKEGIPFNIKIHLSENLKALALIQYEDLKILLLEYLNKNETILDLFEKEPKLCIANRYQSNLYDMSGNTTYVSDALSRNAIELEDFKFYDLVLKNNNKYLKDDEVNNEEYQNILICDETPVYLYKRNEINDEIIRLIGKFVIKGKNVVLKTTFKKISNIRDFRLRLKYLSQIILFDDITYLYFKHKEDETISIIDYNKEKIESLEKLMEIIKNNNEENNILVKTTVEEIKNNNYRIGFKLYQDGQEFEKRNINTIVDENTRLIDRLKDYDSIIAQEIDELINR